MGESYVAGEWDTDDLPRFMELAVRDCASIDEHPLILSPRTFLSRIQKTKETNSLPVSRRNVSYHYDLGNEFYRVFLDESMTYSCALFRNGTESLEQAQENKYDLICKKLKLNPGLRLLEIGCGWGGFALYQARQYGCHITSITLSNEQYDYAKQQVQASGLEDKIEIQLCDYRLVEGKFDRIVSIEMFEAVGYEYFGAFFEKCDRLLAPNGVMVMQTITIPDPHFDQYRRGYDWIRKHIFPGGLMPSRKELVRAIASHSRLVVEHEEDIGFSYAKTLKCWREKYLKNIDSIRAKGFGDRFVRLWDFYLASCEALFQSNRLGVLQIVLDLDK